LWVVFKQLLVHIDTRTNIEICVDNDIVWENDGTFEELVQVYWVWMDCFFSGVPLTAGY